MYKGMVRGTITTDIHYTRLYPSRKLASQQAEKLAKRLGIGYIAYVLPEGKKTIEKFEEP